MALIHFLPDEIDIEAHDGETVLAASLRAGIPHQHLCGGHARCSTCRIEIQQGAEHCVPLTVAEQRIAEQLRFDAALRLACQTVADGPLTVRRLVLDDQDAKLVDQRPRESSEELSAAGEERELAILFADIRGFTAFSESRPPYDVVHVLNKYFHVVGQPIEKHGGYIDNYMGDGLMALFGLRDDSEDSPVLRALHAGFGMLQAMDSLKSYLLAAFGQSFDIGIGIHYGVAVVGSVGAIGSERVTAIGDAVNMASRIESANKLFGTQLLLSQEAHEQVARYAQVASVHEVVLPGKSGTYKLVEIASLR
jgi:adenylate cyclase